MMTQTKVVLRWAIARSAFLASLIWLVRALRDSRSTRKIAKSNGFKIASVSDLLSADDKERTRLYILGSGESILDLEEVDFEQIGKSVSVGITAWVIHNFVPDFYAFETGRATQGPEEDTLFLSKELRKRSMEAGRSPIALFLRPTLPARPDQLIDAPSGMKRVMYGRVNLEAVSPNKLSKHIQFVLRFSQLFGGLICSAPDVGASVFRLLSLGVLSGYREIVLVGVDLNSSKYFWHSERSPSSFLVARQHLPRPEEVAHGTTQTTNRPFGVDTAIVSLAEVSKRFGTEIYVASAKSALSTELSIISQ